MVVLNGDDLDQNEILPPPGKKRHKSLDNITSHRNLPHRTVDAFSNVKIFALEEGVEISRILGLLLTKCETSLALRCGKLLWEANYDPLPENNKSSLLVPVETALAIYHDSSPGRQTYSN